MATNPYSSVSVSNYNNSPPPDDGTTGADNQLSWDKHKTKLGDPLKTALESINTNVSTAFGKTVNTDANESNALAGSLAFTSSEITLATTGSATPTRTHHTVGPNPATATSDDLDTLATGSVGDGAVVFLRAADADKRVGIRSGQGNIFASNRVLSPNNPVALLHVGANWHEVALPPGHISGLAVSNNGTDGDHDIDIAVGSARCDLDSENLNLGAAITKRIDASWAVGSDQGGLDGTESSAGTPDASTMYYVWMIKRTDTGVVDALFSESSTAPTMPANYDRKRLVGAVRTDASANIIAFVHTGNEFWYTGDVVQDVADSTITSDTFEVGTLSVPPNSTAFIYGNVTNTGETATNMRLTVRRNGAADDLDEREAIIGLQNTSDPPDVVGASALVPVDGSSQVQYGCREIAGTATANIRTRGFVMHSRSNP